MSMQTLQNHSTIVKWCLVLHYFTKTCLVKKGRSHLLLRKGLIKREKELRAEQKEKDLKLLNSIPSLTEQIEDLKKELQEKRKSLKSIWRIMIFWENFTRMDTLTNTEIQLKDNFLFSFQQFSLSCFKICFYLNLWIIVTFYFC